MILKKFEITEASITRSFNFSNGNNLIHSNDNSRGKTTLLRLILYCMGYNIPSTKKMKFEKCSVSAEIISDGGQDILLSRNSLDYLTMCVDNTKTTICLPDQHNIVLQKIYSTDNTIILSNLLGSFYLDQEKGWTLLNRGIVIGSIRFSIEELIQGLSNRDCSSLKEQERRVSLELEKYKHISNVVKYRDTLNKDSGSLISNSLNEEIDTMVEQKRIEIGILKKELSRIDRVLSNNKQIRSYIDEMRLVVNLPSGEKFVLTSERLIGLNDSVELLVAKRKIKTMEYNNLCLELDNLIRNQNEAQECYLFSTESISDAFDEMIQKFPYGYVKIERIKNKLNEQVRDIRKQISEQLRFNNDVVTSLYTTISNYAEELGIADYISQHPNYIFTSDLKSLSGAVLHKTVFAFRLACIIEIRNRLNICLPIILDSPTGKEVDHSNIELMIQILNRDFKNHQIIIASIFNYQNLHEVNQIELINMLVE